MIGNHQLQHLLEQHARGNECGLWDDPAPAAVVIAAPPAIPARATALLTAALSAAVAIVIWQGLVHAPRSTVQVAVATSSPVPTIQTIRPPVRNISFDNVRFLIEKDQPFDEQMLTPEINNLAGTAVRIRGYMLPHYMNSGITRFVLVRDNLECCFGPGAALYDCMLVDLEAGRTTDYRVQPVTIEGRLEIRPEGDDPTRPVVLYHLVESRVQ